MVATADAGCDAEKGRKVMEDMLTRRRDLDAVFSSSDSQSIGMVKALQAADQDPLFVSFDAQRPIVNNIKSGVVVDASVAWSARELGADAVKAAVAAARREPVERIDPRTRHGRRSRERRELDGLTPAAGATRLERARPGDRGRGFGAAQTAAVAVTVAGYRRLLSEAADLSQADLLRAGETVGERLANHSPRLVDELEGIAAGAGQDVRELLAINARTELLAGTQAGGECSLIARRASAGPWLAQTWDWHPALRPAAVLWSVRRAGGWFQTVTEAGVLAKLGHNSHGLACGLNFLTCSADSGPKGLPIHTILRLLLDDCATADEARAL